MDSHKRSAQLERLEVVETGRRRRWSEDEKLKIVLESLRAPRAVSSTARRYGISRSLLIKWRRSFRPERHDPEGQQIGFVPAMVVPETAPTVPAVPARGRMVIVIANGRRVIVDAGVDAARSGAGARGSGAPMIPIPSGVKVWIATGVTDMRRGMNGLSLQVQEAFGRDPHAGDLYVFRGRRGDLIKVLWHDGLGLSLYAKRLDRGRFVWPSTAAGVVAITSAQLGYLLEAIDWRNPQHTWRPQSAG